MLEEKSNLREDRVTKFYYYFTNWLNRMTQNRKRFFSSMKRIKVEPRFRVPNSGVLRRRPAQVYHQFDWRPIRRRLELVVEGADRRRLGLDADEVFLDDVFITVVLVVKLVHLLSRYIDLKCLRKKISYLKFFWFGSIFTNGFMTN